MDQGVITHLASRSAEARTRVEADYAAASLAPMPAARRFPPPWIVEEHKDACFIVKDATGQALGFSISRRSSVGARRMSALRQLRS
jgi:hypothetical protein